jgi:hypothetical protein
MALLTGSVFCVDDPISSLTQNPGITGLQSLTACAALSNAGAKVTGALRGPPPMMSREIPPPPPSLVGVHAYLGYPAPWMMYQIQADSFARGAFANGTGEMFSQTINWEAGRRAEPVAPSQDRSVSLPALSRDITIEENGGSAR